MKLPGLVKVLAEGDERGEATLNHIARVIREAGHLPTTKRGPGASDMGAREAANLLIGASGSDIPANAAVAVAQYRPLTLSTAGYKRRDLEGSAWWSRVKAAPNFGEALEALINSSYQDLREALSAFSSNLGNQSEVYLYRNIKFARPEPTASIAIIISPLPDLENADADTRISHGIRFELVFTKDESQPLLEPFSSTARGRIVEVTIRDHTIRLLSEAYAEPFAAEV